MTAEVKSRAVEPFFTTKPPGIGSGHGLSQVYGFVRQSNGQIEIDSGPGRGTTVRMFLPRLLDAGQANVDARAPERKAGSVLITEDDPDVLTVSVETLRILGYEVYSAANAAEAITILKRDVAIDVLFTDVVMPNGMNGIELAREARRLRPELRVLLCSGYSRNGVQTDKTTTFLTKPYLMSDLARELAALMPHPPYGR